MATSSAIHVSASYASDCHVDRYSFVFQSDTSTRMEAKSGTNCYSRITAHSSIDSSRILRQPLHGSAFIDGTHRWGYRSAPGYSGPDAFVVGLNGTSYHKGRSGSLPLSGETNIAVDVQVDP